MKYGINNFLRIANSYVNAETTSLAGLDRSLKAWFVFNYNTTLSDPRLLDMTLEELLVLYQMFQIREHPTIVEQINGASDAYEDWLRKEMGESYVSEEEMAVEMLEYNKQELELAKQLPDSITTNFSDLAMDED